MPVDSSESGKIPPELTDPFDAIMKRDYTLDKSRLAFDFAPLGARFAVPVSPVDRGRDTKVTIVSPPFVTSDSTKGSCPGGCPQPCHCSSQPEIKSLVVLKGTGVIKIEEDMSLSTPSHPEHSYSQSLIFNTLLRFGKKRLPRPSAGRRIVSHVTLGRVTKPVTYFKGRGELAVVFRSFAHTLLILRKHGLEAINVSLENLAIAPREPGKGKGIITCFDDETHDPSWKQRPRFIYTMPCRTLLTDDLPDPTRLVGLESILLCLIWIVTTRSGAFDQRRTDYLYYFDATELGRWNKRDWYNDPSGRYQDERKLGVMRSKGLFESRVLGDIHPHFEIFKIFLRALRTLIYDPLLQSTRDVISNCFVADHFAKYSAYRKFTDVLNCAVQGDEAGVHRALETQFRPTDQCTTIGKHENGVSSKEALEKLKAELYLC